MSNIEKENTSSGNLQAIISLIADDEAVQATFGVFLDHMKKRTKSLDEYIQSQNFDEILKSAHKIKGSAGCYGFPQLSDLALALEDEAKKSDASPDLMRDTMLKMHSTIDRIEIGLQTKQ